MCDGCQQACELDERPAEAFSPDFSSLPTEGNDSEGWLEPEDYVDEDGWPL